MAKRPISLLRKGLYWSLALAVGVLAAPGAQAQRKAKAAKPKAGVSRPAPAAGAAEQDPKIEWESINRATADARVRFSKAVDREPVRDEIAGLAIRSAAGAERALALGNAALFDAYRRQFREQFHNRRWRIGRIAARGNAAADYALGVLMLHGFLEPPAVQAACRHFDTALNKGYADAKFRVSQCLQKEDPARAAALMREAADAGHPAAAELLGRACLEASPPQAACARDRLTLAASAGRPSAQSVLAWMYAQGVDGKSDPERAARLYLQAARAGDASAQNNAGELYETGRGVNRDPKLALDWYRKAAEAGFAPAQFNLGRLHAAGNEIPQDFVEARKWLDKAEQAGIKPARELLDWMARQKIDK